MTANKKWFEDMAQEHLLTIFIEYNELHYKVRSLRSPDFPVSDDDYLTWYQLVRMIAQLESMDLFKNLHFPHEVKDFATQILKTAKHYGDQKAMMILAHKGIPIPPELRPTKSHSKH